MNYIKISEGLDVSKIIQELQKNPEVWNQDKDRTWFEDSPHKECMDVWVRHNNREDIQDTKPEDPFLSTWYESAESLPSVVDFSFNLMAAVEGEHLGGVLITKVPAGGKVHPHVDKGWHVDFYDKFYLHLESNDDVEFCWADGTKIKPKAGELYWLDNTKEHWVNNDGSTDRITAIFCIKPFIRMKERI